MYIWLNTWHLNVRARCYLELTFEGSWMAEITRLDSCRSVTKEKKKPSQQVGWWQDQSAAFVEKEAGATARDSWTEEKPPSRLLLKHHLLSKRFLWDLLEIDGQNKSNGIWKYSICHVGLIKKKKNSRQMKQHNKKILKIVNAKDFEPVHIVAIKNSRSTKKKKLKTKKDISVPIQDGRLLTQRHSWQTLLKRNNHT